MLELSREWKAGIPVPGMPFSIMCAICVSESRCTFRLSAMFGARSPPLPSRPWQLAQVDAKVCLPCIATGLESCFAGICLGVCDQAKKRVLANSATRTAANTHKDFLPENIGKFYPLSKVRAAESGTMKIQLSFRTKT